jgi:hypothetical protein
MAKSKIVLPTVVNEEVWFYKENEELLKPHLGKPYISFSTLSSWFEYQEDLIKKKFLGLNIEPGIYADFGSYVGESIEHGEWQENPHGFVGQDNLDVSDRPEGAEYEKIVLIDMGEYVLIGFIDIFIPEEDGDIVLDVKTGKADKTDKYLDPNYIQVVLYAYALQLRGHKIKSTGVFYIERTGWHGNPPLGVGESQTLIDLDFNKDRVDYALKRVQEGVEQLSSCYKTYLKLVS